MESSQTNVAHKLHITSTLCSPAHPYLSLSLRLKFIQLSWKRIIYELICSVEWFVLFTLSSSPFVPLRWDGLSESLTANGATVPKHKIEKVNCL